MSHRTHPGMAAEARRIMERQSSTRPEPLGQLSLRFEPGKSFPTRSAAGRAEQGVLPLRGTIQQRYETWRPTENGTAVYQAMEARALALADAGEIRIGPKSLSEHVRDQLHVEINNDFVALLARELVHRHPHLDPLIPRRERRAT